MKLYRVRAFSLTELLIVLVVVSVLFAALVPIMTGRRNGVTTGDEPVWSFVSNDEEKNAYFDSGMIKQTSAAYVGVKPNNITDKKPYSKLILKANNSNNMPQNMIQFRYGSGNGTLTGIFFADTNGNYLHASRLNGTAAQNYNDLFNHPNTMGNTVIGADAFASVPRATNNIAIGSSAMRESKSPDNNVVVGSVSGKYVDDNNIILGAGSGLGEDIHNNILLGANIMSVEESKGHENIVAGANVAVAGLVSSDSTGNTIIGASQFKAHKLKDSTVIGYTAFVGRGDEYIMPNELTAIGHNACSSIKDEYEPSVGSGSITCIGATSGQATNGTPASFTHDKYDHIFLGGVPSSAWEGRGVVEVHNIGDEGKHSLAGIKPNVGQSVVFNSHLVVRGNLAFPTKDGKLVAVMTSRSPYGDGHVQNRDYCSKCTFLERTMWRSYYGCNKFWEPFATVVRDILNIGTFLAGLAEQAFSDTNYLLSQASHYWGNSFASTSGRKIQKEPVTNSRLNLNSASICGSSGSTCPQLKVSDMRLKENLTENTDALSKIMNITPYSYTYKADNDSIPQVGVIAQDLQQYMPNSVSKDKDGFLQITWDEMFFNALDSIKALDSTLNNLTINIYSLEEESVQIAQKQKYTKTRINDISKRLNKLEK